MGEIVNLRRARKAKARNEAAVQAARNRAAFGRSKAEKQVTDAEQAREQRLLDNHRLDDDTRQDNQDA